MDQTQKPGVVDAVTPSSQPPPWSIHGLYAYRNYLFNTKKLGFNQLQGNSNLYIIGGNNLQISDSLFGGIFLYQLVTHLNISLTPDDSTNQDVHNHSVFAHVLKRVNTNLFIDVLGGYGHNTMAYLTSAPQTDLGNIGFAHGTGYDWFTSLKAVAVRPWRQFNLTGNIGVLYGDVTQNTFTYTFVSPFPSVEIPSIRTNSTLALESAEIGYRLNTNIEPFLNGGLIQVLSYQNTRERGIGLFSIGALPDISSRHGGIQIGGGVTLQYKQFTLRLEQQYYERGDIYCSNQTLASLKIAMG